jgi:hypothetical protein
MNNSDILWIVLVLLSAIVTPMVLWRRRRSHQRFLKEYSEAEICGHLRPALELLQSRGHRVTRAGQRHPELPLEVYLSPAFSPQEIAAELELKDPVFVSERNVLYCKEDWCELHPK